MSIEQLAAATKIPRRSLEMLEEDRYEALPGPVFVKGFLRCAARALGVDVQTVMDLLYERERAALSARRRERPPSAPAMVADEAMPRRLATPKPESRAEPIADAPALPTRPVESSRTELAIEAADEGAADPVVERTVEPAPRRAVDGGAKRRPPRLRARPAAGPSVVERVRAHLPSPAVFLWVVVAAFVAMVVLAAFNLVGGAAPGGPS